MNQDLPSAKKLSTPLTKGTDTALQALAQMTEQAQSLQETLNTKQIDFQSLNESINSSQTSVSDGLQNALSQLQELLTNLEQTSKEVNQEMTAITKTLTEAKGESLQTATQIAEMKQTIKTLETQVLDKMEQEILKAVKSHYSQLQIQMTVEAKTFTDSLIEYYNQIVQNGLKQYWGDKPLTIMVFLILSMLAYLGLITVIALNTTALIKGFILLPMLAVIAVISYYLLAPKSLKQKSTTKKKGK